MRQIHYQRSGWFTVNVFNRLVAVLTRLGVSVWGSRLLAVRGRKTGQWRTTPVNLLEYQGQRYLVAPRGDTHWVRNLRSSGEGRLSLGRRSETFRATELPDSDKTDLLRAYLRRWKFEVGTFFGGVEPNAPEQDLQRIAPEHPVFKVEAARPHTG
ncbi:MAG TPA: nitroreductase family deazaflavin-dependent oxidoreductase [Candidatus Dormibacteraeota bacterium]|jgi:deazaflavin-dependent oxidoreductase (nitroreductase family)|nr:nitroreductase family deazaflavin-dependent oxidoreductase [Candidatus Dormibacteraeota bacterium]